MFPKNPILLGSQSPRRSFLLKEAGYQFRKESIDVDESFPETLQPSEIAAFISTKKAKAYLAILKNNEVGLVADTIVHLKGHILGKPKNMEEAKRMLASMSGEQHDVFTGVTLFDAHKQHTFTGHSKVYFEELTNEEITYYIEHYKPFDKAGAYGIQDWIGYVKINKIEGSYSNIMGLPMELVYKEIQKF